MLVSVITPSYNSEKFIGECLESVNSQIGVNVEHIVVDAYSSDKTDIILSQYPQIKIIKRSPMGMYDAINQGLHIATGDIVCYLNSDDRFFSEKVLERVCALFMANDKAAWLYGNCDFIDGDGVKLRRKVAPPLFGAMMFCSYSGMPIYQPSIFWRRQVHQKIGYFNVEYKLAGDYEFFLRMLIKYDKYIRVPGTPLSCFRVHPASLSTLHKDASRLEVAKMKRDNDCKQPILLAGASLLIYKIFNATSYLQAILLRIVR